MPPPLPLNVPPAPEMGEETSQPILSTEGPSSHNQIIETQRPTEETNSFLDKAPFLVPKSVSHSPKISPSSIPNPSPSVTTTKQLESGYPTYGGYLYSIPGYSAFQPVSYPSITINQNPSLTVPTSMEKNETKSAQFMPFTSTSIINGIRETISESKLKINNAPNITTSANDIPKTQTDFEEQFTPEIIPASNEANKVQITESTMNITSVTQGSGATVTIPTMEAIPSTNDLKKKQCERFSLKTSIPISKIDMKCVNNPPDTSFQNAINKKFNPSFSSGFPILKANETNQRLEIHSNVVIKSAQSNEVEIKHVDPLPNTNITTLINAAEILSKNESPFWKSDQKNEAKVSVPSNATQQQTTTNVVRPTSLTINQAQTEAPNKSNLYAHKPPDIPYTEQKNQVLLIQNKNSTNPKMLLTISQPQNPQVLLHRTNMESKNLQAPSRLSSLNSKGNDAILNEATCPITNKVVALKRLHQDNSDENDFENLITENQIYGNKIVVKEKSQGTLQEQELKAKTIVNKNVTTTEQSNNITDGKSVVLQPNFLYVSNVQFPANLMMIKNSTKINQLVNETVKICNKVVANENKLQHDNTLNTNNDTGKIPETNKSLKGQTVTFNKEIHVLKSSNNVLQTLSSKHNNKTSDVSTNQKVIMNPQIVYQVPMIMDGDKITNPTFVNRDYQKFISPSNNKKDFIKPFSDQTKTNEKLYIACPYQMDSKLQPKIVITNIRSKMPKNDEVSSIDLYEKRRRIRRMKYLSKRIKDCDEIDKIKKSVKKKDKTKNILTPEKMIKEIYKEFASTKLKLEDDNTESDSDYNAGYEIKEYESIIKEYSINDINNSKNKVRFLSTLRLATRDVYKGTIFNHNIDLNKYIFLYCSTAFDSAPT